MLNWLKEHSEPGDYCHEVFKLSKDPMVDLYVVSFSDEGYGQYEAEMRSECGDFIGLETEDFVTVDFN